MSEIAGFVTSCRSARYLYDRGGHLPAVTTQLLTLLVALLGAGLVVSGAIDRYDKSSADAFQAANNRSSLLAERVRIGTPRMWGPHSAATF